GAQNALDRGWGDPMAEFEELPLDLAVAPPGILAGETHDELDERRRDRRPPSFRTVVVGPLAPHDLAMPAQQRGRAEDQGHVRQVREPGGEAGQRDLLPARRPRLLGPALVEAQLL